MSAVIGGNDVRKGWFERLVENAATASLSEMPLSVLKTHLNLNVCEALSHALRIPDSQLRKRIDVYQQLVKVAIGARPDHRP